VKDWIAIESAVRGSFLLKQRWRDEAAKTTGGKTKE